MRHILREKCPNTAFFLVRIFPHLDRKSGKIRTRKNSVLGHFSRSDIFQYTDLRKTLKSISNTNKCFSRHKYRYFVIFKVFLLILIAPGQAHCMIQKHLLSKINQNMTENVLPVTSSFLAWFQ